MTGKTRLLVLLVFVGALIASLVLSTRQEAVVECTVCMEFAGREACRTVSAADRDAALAGAIRNACGVLSSGVTRGMQCDRTPPRSVECSQ